MIFIGIDDTDIIGTPGTNQLARAIVKQLGKASDGAVICRHQLFFDPRVPYTSKNGSASIQLPCADSTGLDRVLRTAREVMRGWFVPGSDPGLCVATGVSQGIIAFGSRCKNELVTQDEARAEAAAGSCRLEGLGGTEQGIIGALAAVGLVAGGDDGRVVHLASWPYPDDFSGLHPAGEILSRGVDDIRELGSDQPVDCGLVDVGKHLRPSWRGRRILLYVEKSDTAEAWRAVKLP